jgi:hypothetical protein
MLLSNTPGLQRRWHCYYQISNIYNLKSYYKTEEGFKPIQVSTPPVFKELMLTQFVDSQKYQHYPSLRHGNSLLAQRDSFYTTSIEKEGDDFYINIKDNWFVKYEGPYKDAVERDYDFWSNHKTLFQKALQIFEEKLQLTTRAKGGKLISTARARSKAKPRKKLKDKDLVKRVRNRGKLLQKIATKSKKQKHVSTKRR